MVQEQLVEDSLENPPQPDEAGLKLRIVLKFFAFWLSSLAILLVIALLSNIEWARRHIETALCQSFHRKVGLGRLSWSLGLQGLAIDTNKFEMKEENSSPFIKSGPSEIGIAVLPLFEGKLVIKHLEFDGPEVWAVKLDDKRWNFSDLLTEGPEIRMLQIEHGQLHLRNLNRGKTTKPSVPAAAPNKTEEPNKTVDSSLAAGMLPNLEDLGNDWQSYDLKDIKFSLTLPNGNRNWPLYLAFKVPMKDAAGTSYDSSLRLSTTGKGKFEDWAKNQYKVDLQLEKFDPSKFRSLCTRLPRIKGICDLSFKGEGVFDKGFAATTSGAISGLEMAAAENKELKIDRASGSASLVIDPANMKWSGLKVSLQDFELDSDGKLENWQANAPSYEARVGGKLSDLKGFFNTIVSRFLPEQAEENSKLTDSKLDKIYNAEKSGELGGSATIELHLKGNSSNHSVSTNIKADGIPLAQLVDDEMGRSLLETFKLDPSSPIRGELSIDPGHKLELKDLEIPMEDSKIQLSGFVDQHTKASELEFKAENLSFDTFKKRIGTDNEIIKAVCGTGGKCKPYAIAGMLDIKGKYKSDGKKPEIFIDSTLKGLKLTRLDSKTASCTDIKGKVIYDKERVEVKQLTGVTAASAAGGRAGDFAINGFFYPKDGRGCQMDLRAHGVSVATLKDWLTRFGVDLQEPGLDKISGDLYELIAQVTMQKSKVNTSFTLNPSDLVVNVSAKDQLRLSSGVINYKNDDLTATDVVLSSRGGKLTLNASMQGELDSLKLRSARIRTDGFEIADLQSMMKNNVAAPASGKTVAQGSNAMPAFLTPNSASLHGKIYGDIAFNPAAGTGVSGVIGFSNAGGKFGKTQVPVEKLTGVAIITKDQLVLQDLTGQMNKSSFALDGVISNYAQPSFNWQGQLRGQFYQDEVDTIMDNLGHGIALSSGNSEALNLRVTGNGDEKTATLKFRGRAGATHGLGLKTAFGVFHQPSGRPLSFGGGLKLDQAISELVLSNFQLSSANEILNANGTFRWANETAEKPASLAFALNTPSPIKAGTLLEIISQNNSLEPAKFGGTSLLNLKVEGPVNDLLLTGSIALDKISMPTVHMENLTGKLDLPGWHLNKADADTTSIAKLQLKSLAMGGLALHDASATLSLEGTNKVIFKDFHADMSGGKISFSGFYNQQNQAYHADINASKLVVDELVKDVIDHSGGVTGLADITLSLDNTGGSDPERALSGNGKFSVYQGNIASLGKLQEKLNGLNILQQGLFGFNVNNLLQAMLPVNSGQFKEVSGDMRFSNGNILFEQVRFEGANLRMRAAGKFDYMDKKMEMAVAGDIPRVSSSLIPGAIGEMSRKVTLQRMFRIVTFKKLKDLPALPILGDLANDDPRAFAFSVETSTEQPKVITQAVEKSFKWLPNKPFASAHPVPGM